MTPRGIRNNNPGNVRKGERWQGLAAPSEMTPEQKAEKAFCVFRSPEWGIRAIARILNTYSLKYGLDTPRGIIGRWAPPNENDTDSYVRAVAESLNVGPDDVINLSDQNMLRPLIKAIILHENGVQPYGDKVINAGMTLADMNDGGHPAEKKTPPENVTQSSTIKASGTQLVAMGGAAITAITQTEGLAQLLIIGFAGLTVLLSLWIMRERIKKMADGI